MSADPLRLAARFRDSRARIGIIGMGYVGLPLMLAAAAAGFRTLGFDIDAPKVEGLNEGRSPLEHVGHARIAAARAAGRFEATADFARLAEPDALLICVPTPLGRHRSPTSPSSRPPRAAIAAALRPGQLVVLESTTWPGTTRRGREADPGSHRPPLGAGLLPRLLPRARGSGQSRLRHRRHPQGRRRRRPARAGAGHRPLRPARRRAPCPSPRRKRRRR